MASQSAATPLKQVNEESRYYVVDPDEYPISTLSITYRVQQTESGPLIDFGSTAKIMVANASQPLALYDVASNLGNHDPRYTESEWLSPDLCQRIALSLLGLCRLRRDGWSSPQFEENGDLCIWLAKHQASPNPDGSARYLYTAKTFYREETKIQTVRQDGWPTGLEALNALARDISQKTYVLEMDPAHLRSCREAEGFLDRPFSHTEADVDVARSIILPHQSDPI